jgi:hypothetical protein
LLRETKIALTLASFPPPEIRRHTRQSDKGRGLRG